jgi:hypothetical protein
MDGGTHVDNKLTPEYFALAKDGAAGTFVYSFDNQKVEELITNAHLVSLRQIGYELLNSPELLCICGA